MLVVIERKQLLQCSSNKQGPEKKDIFFFKGNHSTYQSYEYYIWSSFHMEEEVAWRMNVHEHLGSFE